MLERGLTALRTVTACVLGRRDRGAVGDRVVDRCRQAAGRRRELRGGEAASGGVDASGRAGFREGGARRPPASRCGGTLRDAIFRVASLDGLERTVAGVCRAVGRPPPPADVNDTVVDPPRTTPTPAVGLLVTPLGDTAARLCGSRRRLRLPSMLAAPSTGSPAAEYRADSVRYDFVKNAAAPITTMTRPENTNTRAMPRPIPSPSNQPRDPRATPCRGSRGTGCRGDEERRDRRRRKPRERSPHRTPPLFLVRSAQPTRRRDERQAQPDPAPRTATTSRGSVKAVRARPLRSRRAAEGRHRGPSPRRCRRR